MPIGHYCAEQVFSGKQCTPNNSLSLSLSLPVSHTHTHAYTHMNLKHAKHSDLKMYKSGVVERLERKRTSKKKDRLYNQFTSYTLRKLLNLSLSTVQLG